MKTFIVKSWNEMSNEVSQYEYQDLLEALIKARELSCNPNVYVTVKDEKYNRFAWYENGINRDIELKQGIYCERED